VTTPPPTVPNAAPSPEVPLGVRVASTIAWVVGILWILTSIAVGIPAIPSGVGVPFIAVNVGAALIVCIAAIQIRRQRKLGVVLMLLAWVIPTILAVVQHRSVRGSLLLFLALLFAGANWKHFR